MVVRADLVDKHVQFNFHRWKEELEAEDIRMFGSVIRRSDKDLELLHKMYLKSQYSNEFKLKRKNLCK